MPASPPGGHPPPRQIDLANIALQYRGYGYVYGGNASSPGDWDCSSFVSFCLHEAGLSLPGGAWGQPGMPPNSHGPVVLSYVYWNGANTVSSPKAGDLCCWAGAGPNGHIGIAVSPHQMISALNPTDGVQVTGIAGVGPSGVPLVFRHVTGVSTTIAKGVISIAGPPKPGRESWQAQVISASGHFNKGRGSLHHNSKLIGNLAIRRN